MNHTLQQIYYAAINKNKSLGEITDEIDTSFRTEDGEIVVFISVANAYSRALVGMGKNSDSKVALEYAYKQYKSNKPANFKPISVKIDVVTDMRPAKSSQKKVNLEKDTVLYKRGEDGISIGPNFDAAFLPEEVEAYRMIVDQKIKPENIFNAYEKHSLLSKNSLVKRLLTSQSLELYKFQTQSYYIDEEGFTPLYRGHRMYSDLSKQDLRNAVALTKNNYFKNVVNTKGKFIYSYLPQENRNRGGYNILRHAGTTYSMLETYELMPDEHLLNASKRAINYLLKKAKELEINGQKVQVIIEKDQAKLGGNALAVVALAKYTQVTKDKQYLPIMQSMATWMRELQDDNGRFAFHKQKYSTGEATDFVSHYYPGEAILALVRLYQIDGNEQWLDVAENEANFLITIRDKEATSETIAHDHWLLYGLNELYRERPKDIYINHAFFISRAIMQTQILEDNGEPEWKGAFDTHRKPLSTPVACRSEGLSAAYKLAVDHGYDEEAKQIKQALHESIKFQLQMQLRPETTMYLENKKLCLGAVHHGLTNYELRNDYTQHNISSFIAYHNILSQDSK
ncbi:beta-L-arabinofuranosidase domain-containing protein [Natribacillus halophilus]|uniref:beta-L-arabinofuranosidase domain-containing protein n=1 Tax=Natribacillus halophilus TaxID=549003 RepID=UPI00159FF9A1|nr:beta-L-arabinofuranosidase domain-containing protein [Natribacillus halophilus]